MANTTNFGWETPDDTDLVKDGAAAIRTLGSSIDTSFVDLKGGTTGQVLSKTSNTDLDFTWVAQDDSNAIQNAIVDAKGDLITATAADTPARLPVGTNGQFLKADSTTATGLAWGSGGSGWSVVNQSAIAYNSATTAAGYLNGTWLVGGDSGGLATSTDGTTWTARTSGTAEALKCFATNNTVYLYGAGNATIRSATDPTSTWTSRNSNLNGAVTRIIWDGTKFVAVSNNQTNVNKISTSTDGTTWTARYTGTIGLNAVANNGSANFVAVGFAGGTDSGYLTSTNGTSWTLSTVANGGTMSDVVWNGTTFVIVGLDLAEEYFKIYTLSTAGNLAQVGRIEDANWAAGSRNVYPSLLWDGTNYWLQDGLGSVYKGGSNFRFTKYSQGYDPLLDTLAQPQIAYNAGNYLGAGGFGIIAYGSEPRV